MRFALSVGEAVENAISLFRQCVSTLNNNRVLDGVHHPEQQQRRRISLPLKEASQMKILYVTHKHWKVISLGVVEFVEE